MLRSINIASNLNLAALFAVFLMLLGIFTLNFQPVSAVSVDPTTFKCGNHLKEASWGRGCAFKSESHFLGKSHDILTDGYCVRAKRKKDNGNVVTVSGSKSCGDVKGWRTDAYSYNSTQWVRLVRDNGNYITLWRD